MSFQKNHCLLSRLLPLGQSFPVWSIQGAVQPSCRVAEHRSGQVWQRRPDAKSPRFVLHKVRIASTDLARELLTLWNKSLDNTRALFASKIGKDMDEIRLAAQHAARLCEPQGRARTRAQSTLEPQWFFRLFEEVERMARCNVLASFSISEIDVSFDVHLLTDTVFSLTQLLTKKDILQKCRAEYAARLSSREKRKRLKKMKRSARKALQASEDKIVRDIAEEKYQKFGHNVMLAQYWSFWAFDIAKAVELNIASLSMRGGKDPRESFMHACVGMFVFRAMRLHLLRST